MRILFLLILIMFTCNANAINVVRDAEAEIVLEKLIAPLLKAADLPKSSLSIYLYQDPEPNAFVFGGQNIFISTAIISLYKDPSGLLGVLAHEIGHIKGGHIVAQSREMKNLEKQFALGVIAAAIAGLATKSTDASIAALQTTQSLTMQNYFAFSQTQESSADSGAIKIMQRVGINPNGLITFLKYLKTEQRANIGDQTVYLSTHPLVQSRIDNLQANFSDQKQYTYPTLELKEKYERISTKIKAFTAQPGAVMSEYAKDNSTNGKYAKAIASYRLGKMGDALEFLEEIQKSEPSNPYFTELKAQIYLDYGDSKASVKLFEASYKALPHSDIMRYELSLAMLSELHPRSRDAVNLLEKNVTENPTDSESWKLLAQGYNNLKESGNSQIATAYWAFLNGDIHTTRKYLATLSKMKLPSNSKSRVVQLESLVENYSDEM